MEAEMEISRITVTRRDDVENIDDDDDGGDRRVVVSRVSVPMQLMDHQRDDEIDDCTREYLARSKRYSDAWRHGRGADVEATDVRRVRVASSNPDEPAIESYEAHKQWLASAYKQRPRGYIPKVKEQPWLEMPPGSRKPNAGLAGLDPRARSDSAPTRDLPALEREATAAWEARNAALRGAWRTNRGMANAD
jgi:hypothetical protein